MNILADLHHSGLYNSLQLLFEKRLGHTLYRPIGMDWYEKGFWNVYPSIDTAKQYLQMDISPSDGTPIINPSGQTTLIGDHKNRSYHKAIRFGEFMVKDIDIVIASIPQHVKPFKELAAMKRAKFIFQMGNVFLDVNLNEIPNLMANTLPLNIPPTCHYIQYHQEISDVFKPSSTTPQPLITSFINVYDHNAGWQDYMKLRAEMPSHEFRSYGGQCKDGAISTETEIASFMQRSQFGFHSKYMGDGFGHVLYDWFASGRPVITRISDYKGKLGEELLTHMETCIDLDVCNTSEVNDIIINMPPLRYIVMCQNVRDRFDKYVNYDSEEVKIRKFLEELNA